MKSLFNSAFRFIHGVSLNLLSLVWMLALPEPFTNLKDSGHREITVLEACLKISQGLERLLNG